MLGKVLGPVEIERELGSKELGKLYAVRVKTPAYGFAEGAPLHVKRIDERFLADEEEVERFQQDGVAAVRVRHPNVARVYEVGTRWGRLQLRPEHLIVSDPLEGQTVAELLEELGRLPEPFCRHIGRAVARGLAAIHKEGLTYAALRPARVLITTDHEVKLLHLGIGRAASNSIAAAHERGLSRGLTWAAPEQLLRDGHAPDTRLDLWCLGLLLYELATGTQPARSRDPEHLVESITHGSVAPLSKLRPEISPFLEEVVRKLLSPERERRFSDAAELAAILDGGEATWWWRERALAKRTATHKPLRRAAPAPKTKLYGRHDQLGVLEELFDAAKAGAGQVVLIEGETGVGTSRMADSFADLVLAREDQVNVLRGAYALGATPTAAGAFTGAVREHFGDEGPEGALGNVLVDTSPDLVPRFASLLLETPTPGPARPAHSEVIQIALVRTLRALADNHPTVLIIEDLHLAPEAGRMLFAAAARTISSARVVLVGTAALELDAAWADELERTAPTHRLRLNPLQPVDILHLLVEDLGSTRLAEDLTVPILQSTGGNAFHVFAALRWLRESGILARDEDGAWIRPARPGEIRVPAVHDLIGQRLDALDDDESAFLDVAACQGLTFDPARVGENLDTTAVAALRRATRIERRHGLIRSAGAFCRFDHARVLETIYGRLRRRLRTDAGDDPRAAILVNLLRDRGISAALPVLGND